MSRAFSIFVRRLSSTTVPAVGDVGAPASSCPTEARAEEDFEQLSASSSAVRYQLAIEDANLSRLLFRFDRDYVALGSRLNDLG